MKKLILLITIFSLYSCEDFKGQFNSQSSLELKDGKIISAGSYASEVKIKGKKKIKLKLKNAFIDETIKIKLNQNLENSMKGGLIEIPAQANDQSLQLSGSIETDYSNSGIKSAIESCTLLVPVKTCKRVCSVSKPPPRRHGNNGKKPKKVQKPKKKCKKVCNVHNVLVSGSQQVQYHYSTKTKYLDLAVYSSVGNLIGDFSGSSSDSSKNYDFIGDCLRY